jgi:hypothetical protein
VKVIGDEPGNTDNDPDPSEKAVSGQRAGLDHADRVDRDARRHRQGEALRVQHGLSCPPAPTGSLVSKSSGFPICSYGLTVLAPFRPELNRMVPFDFWSGPFWFSVDYGALSTESTMTQQCTAGRMLAELMFY